MRFGVCQGAEQAALIDWHTSGAVTCIVIGRAGREAHLDHLGWQVVQSPAERLPAGVWRVHRPAKVCNLELPMKAQQQVLWFDVPMDDMLGVAVHQCLCQ